MKNEIRNNLMLKILNHAFVFLINIFMVRVLGGSQSAMVINQMYRLTILSFLFSLGMDYAVIRSISMRPQLYGLWYRILFFSVFLSVPISIATFYFLPIFKSQESQNILIAVIFTFGQTLIIVFQGLLSAVKRFFVLNMIPILINGMFILWLGFVFLNQTTIDSPKQMLYWVSLCTLIQGLLMVFVSFPSKEAAVHEPDWKSIRQDLIHGITIMFSTLVYFVFIRTDQFFAEKNSDPVDFGNYVQCGKIGQYFLLFASMVSSMLLPFISEKNQTIKYDSWLAMVKPYVLIMIGCALGIGFLGPWIFPYLFGHDFVEMYKTMNILLPGYLALGLLTLLNAFYIGKGRLKRMVLGDVMGLITLITINLIFSGDGNVITIAMISTCCYIGLFLFMGFGIKKRLAL